MRGLRLVVILSIVLASLTWLAPAHAQEADAGVAAEPAADADAAPVAEVEVGAPEPWTGPPPEEQPESRGELAPRTRAPSAEGAVHSGGKTEADDGVVVRVGQDFTWASGGEGAPLVGNLEFGVTTERMKLGYFTFRAEILGHELTAGLNELGLGGQRSRTMACFLCFNVGWRLARVDGPGSLSPGHVTAGVHMETSWAGSPDGLIVIGLGPEVGYMTRKGKWFMHAHLSGSIVRKYGDDEPFPDEGYAGRAELDGFWRGLGPVAVYGRVGYGYGRLADDATSYSYGGPIVAIGFAWVSR